MKLSILTEEHGNTGSKTLVLENMKIWHLE